ncbi:MAG: hypothetical protein RDU30_15335 [Desulfovibrionaceae bacterium]|nr:hypothetical protein [Desulfovibrionaceae bacterium]
MKSIKMQILGMLECRNQQVHSMPSEKAVSEIESLKALQVGWNFGRGQAFADEIIQTAKVIFKYAQFLGLHPEVCPTDDGDILLSFQNGEDFLDITIFAEGIFEATVENGIGDDYISHEIGLITFGKLKGLLLWFANPLTKILSEYSTFVTTSVSANDVFRSQRFAPHAVVAVSPSLMITAESSYHPQPVNI